MNIKIVTKEELTSLVRGVLEDRHFEILHVAYLRYRKREFKNYNWIAEAILQDYKISIPVKTYTSLRQIQNELAKLPFDEVRPFIVYVLELFKREGERHLSKTKYKSVWELSIAMDRYNLQTRLGEDHMEPARPKKVVKASDEEKVTKKVAPTSKKVATTKAKSSSASTKKAAPAAQAKKAAAPLAVEVAKKAPKKVGVR